MHLLRPRSAAAPGISIGGSRHTRFSHLPVHRGPPPLTRRGSATHPQQHLQPRRIGSAADLLRIPAAAGRAGAVPRSNPADAEAATPLTLVRGRRPGWSRGGADAGRRCAARHHRRRQRRSTLIRARPPAGRRRRSESAPPPTCSASRRPARTGLAAGPIAGREPLPCPGGADAGTRCAARHHERRRPRPMASLLPTAVFHRRRNLGVPRLADNS